jgi:DNA polymerase elongation subunit (family B)
MSEADENIIRPATTNVYCNIIDWVSENVGDEEDKKFVIRFFGRTNTGLSLTVTVNNFLPYFFIKIPRSWSSTQAKKLVIGMKSMSKDHGRYIYDDQPIAMEFKEFYGFKGDLKYNFLKIRFQCSDSMKFYHNRSRDGILELRIDGRNEKFQLYESNFDPMLRFMHIQDIKSCGWVKLPKGLYRAERDTIAFTDYHLRINAENLVSQQNFTSEDPKLGLGKFKICSFDLECYSHDEEFPQPDRKEDPIIQIGMVFQTIGELEPIRYILTLKKCNEIENTNVLSFEKEGDMLMDFQRIIQEEDPDILTGYNIYGFDEKYIYGRVKLLRLSEFGFLSRLGTRTEFKENVKLSSAALGDNQMHFYNTVGRVQIDLMKLIQKDYKLNSYKLDSVAEHFMREIIKKIEIIGDVTRIYIKKPGEFKLGNFIKISEEDDIISDKLKIINLTKEYLDIRGNLTYILDNDMIAKKTSQHVYFFAGIVKDDINFKDMFRFYEKGDPVGITTIAQYCIQDCILPVKLLLKLNKIPENMEMASISSVPMQWIFLRGQGIKSFSLVVKKCRKKGFLIKVLPRIQKSDDDDDKVGYEGAIVLTPEPKFHRVPISVNDYSSLYPSSMIAENISHEMYVEDPQYDNLPNYIYNTIKFDQELPNGTKEEVICRYAKKPGEFGVIPEILNDLLTERKAVRKLAESETDVFMKAVYEGRQLALKLTANSLYGQIGAATSPVCYVRLAASTTAVGRGQIMIAKNFVEQDFKNTLQYIYDNHNDKDKLHEFFTEKLKNKAGKTLADDEKEVNKIVNTVKEVFDKYDINPKVVYGDSVASYTPILIRDNGIIKIITIEELGSNFNSCTEDSIFVSSFYKNYNTKSDKEYCELSNIECWTDNEWTPVKRIIRHKLDKSKKMIRVLTYDGLVDVTDDHSLIRSTGEPVSSKELKLGDKLLHYEYPTPYIYKTGSSYEEMAINGFFIVHGSLNVDKNEWLLLHYDMNLLEKYKEYCGNVYPEFYWEIKKWDKYDIDDIYYTLKPKLKKYDNSLKVFISIFKKYIYENNRKNIPSSVFSDIYKNKLAFWEGLTNITDIKEYTSIELDNQVIAAQVAYLANILGYQSIIDNRSTKPNVYRVICNQVVQNYNLVKKMSEIPYSNDDYVYDLTTDNHHFQAGIGKLIVHNTDSIFNDFVISDKVTGEVIHTKETLQPAIELGILVSKFVQSRLRFPHELSYEKTFFPFAIFSKKRYVGNKYTEDDKEYTMTSMGIVLKRRDNAMIVKRVIGGMIEIMMNDIDCKKTVDFTTKSIKNIFKGKFPIKDFVTSKTIKDINKYKTSIKKDKKGEAILDADGNEQNFINIGHVMLAQKMIKEKRSNAPQMNDRVPFAYIEVPKLKGQKILQGEKIEHPDYIIENNLKLDYMFYITNQIMTPAIQFLELVTAKPEDATILFNDLIKEEECKRKGIPYTKTVSLDRWLN